MTADTAARLQTALGGAYRIERELGGGGMSSVFLAEETALGRRVVVKVLPPELATAMSSDRFAREVRLAAQLQHPNVVPVLAAGDAAGLPYYVMPYVEGESLAQRLESSGEALPVREAVRILRDVARALAFAHARGVVHRDVKPANILLAADAHGAALVSDFGIAKALTSAAAEAARTREVPGRSTPVTTPGLVLGTPAYMAPEQATGDPQVDHRADLYALGVVAYELLAGRRPFGDRPAAAIAALALAERPAPLERLRPETPPELARLVARCLEYEPAERPRSADEVLATLEDVRTPAEADAPAAARPRARPGRPAHRTAAVAVVLAALGLGTAVLRRTSAAAGGLDSNLVAVAPFEVLGAPDRQIWREGLVDLLSRNLDGAGPIRAVPPSVAIARWRGRAEPAAAAALGRATGAGLVVFGSLEPAGVDSVRLIVSVVNAGRGRPVGGDIHLREAAARMDRLTDSLTVRVLREIGRTSAAGDVRLAGVGSSSPAALKAFLQGEGHFRRSAWDSARVHYERAVAADTTFALAYWRLGNARYWLDMFDSLGGAYIARAGQLNRGLARRESLLVATDSLFRSLHRHDPDVLARVDRMFATAETAASEYPSDPETWYMLGDVRMHTSLVYGRPIAQHRLALEAFDRAIRADSGFTPAAGHAVWLAFTLDGRDEGMRYARAYLRRNPQDAAAAGIRVAVRILDSERADAPETRRMLDTASGLALLEAARIVAPTFDPGEPEIRLARLAIRRGAVQGAQRIDSLLATATLLDMLAGRGRVREAVSSLRRLPALPRTSLRYTAIGIAVTGAIPADSADSLVAWAADAMPSPAGRAGFGLAWWASRGRHARISAALALLDSASRAPGATLADARNRRQASVDAEVARAMLALARGDSVGALRQLDAAARTRTLFLSNSLPTTLLTYARLLAAAGRDREALALLRMRPFCECAEQVVWSAEAGRVAERLGERGTAVDAYAAVAAALRHPDPPLRPLAAEARAALRRLGSDERRGTPARVGGGD